MTLYAAWWTYQPVFSTCIDTYTQTHTPLRMHVLAKITFIIYIWIRLTDWLECLNFSCQIISLYWNMASFHTSYLTVYKRPQRNRPFLIKQGDDKRYRAYHHIQHMMEREQISSISSDRWYHSKLFGGWCTWIEMVWHFNKFPIRNMLD